MTHVSIFVLNLDYSNVTAANVWELKLAETSPVGVHTFGGKKEKTDLP